MNKKYRAIYVDPNTGERLSICYCLGHSICSEDSGTVYELGEDIEEPEDALSDIKNYISSWHYKDYTGMSFLEAHPEYLDDPKYQWLKIENWHVEEVK